MKLDAPTITKLIVLLVSIAAIVALALLHAVTGGEALDKIEVLASVGIGSLGLVSVTGILAKAFGPNLPAASDAKPAALPAPAREAAPTAGGAS